MKSPVSKVDVVQIDGQSTTNVGPGIGGGRDTNQLSDEALLADLGYKQEFKREFTAIEVFGVAFSIIGLLPSIASVLFNAIPNGGPVAMVWGWLVASFFILLVGLAMAELGSAAPTSGGLYFWTYSLCPPRSRTLMSWLVGYTNTIGSVAAVASIAWGCAVQVMAAASIGSSFDDLNEEGGVGFSYTATNGQTFAVYALILLTSCVICSAATRILARLQTLYVVLNILLCLVVIIALPLATPSNRRNNASYALGGFVNLSGWPDGFAFILSFLAPLWTICSFDSAVHISEEAANAATAVPWAIVGSISVAAVLGLAINISLAFSLPPASELSSLLDSPIGQPMAAIFFTSFGKRGTLAIWAVVVIVQYMMGTSALLAASRQSFAFARDGALPLTSFLKLDEVNKRTQTPINTVWYCGFWSALMGCLVFIGDGQAVDAVFALSVVALYVAYGIPIGARLIGRLGWRSDISKGGFNKDANKGVSERVWMDGPFSLGIFSTPVSFVALLFLVSLSAVFLFPEAPSPDAESMNYTAPVLGGVLLLSIGWYYFPIWGGRYWFEGPKRNVDEPANANGSVRVTMGSGSGSGVEVYVNTDGEVDVSVEEVLPASGRHTSKKLR